MSDYPLSNISYGEPAAAIYLARTFTFFSNTFLFPFRIKWSEEKKRYKLAKYSSCQKIFPLLFTLGVGLTFFGWTFHNDSNMSSLFAHESGVIFVIAGFLFVFMFLTFVNYLYMIWFRHEVILSMLNSFVVIYPSKTCPMPSPLIYLLPATLFFSGILVMFFTIPGKFSQEAGSKMGIHVVNLVLKYVVRLDVEHPSSFHLALTTALGYFFKFTVIMGSSYTISLQCLLLVLTVSLRKLGNQIATVLKDHPDLPIHSASAIHDSLLGVASAVNKAFGNVVFLSYVSFMFYVIQAPLWWVTSSSSSLSTGGDTDAPPGSQEVDPVDSLSEKLDSSTYLLSSATVWWAAGEWHLLVQSSLSKWIQKRSLVPSITMEERVQLMSLSHSVQACSVALSCRYFAITHKLICSTCGAILTYGVIVLQLLTPATRHLFYQLQRNVSDAITSKKLV